jgi:CHAD domain-containing protein
MKAYKKYLKNRISAIIKILAKPRHEYTVETFHNLRVEIKKLHALFDLINYSSKHFKRRKTFKIFKLIFYHAGKVRELQIEEIMLHDYLPNTVNSSYRKSLKVQQFKEKERFFSLINKKFIAKLKSNYQQLIPALKALNSKKVKGFWKKRLEKTEKIISEPNLKTPQIHELRKQLKILNYISKIVRIKKQKISFLRHDYLPELIGKWHDCDAVIAHLNKIINNGIMNTVELTELKKVNSKLFDENSQLLNKINIEIHTLAKMH